MGYWKKRNVAYSKPWPLLGSMAPFVFGKKSSQELMKDIYDTFPDKRYTGLHTFVTPALLIRDPDLIKQIGIKDFEYFTDHALFRTIDDIDPFLSKSLLMLCGKKWRDMRATLSPLFSSSKMKFMFTLISECAEDFTEFFQKQGSDVSVEMKDIFSRFIIDAVATTSFGLKVDSLSDRSNAFFLMGKDLSNVQGLRAFRLMVYVAFPWIMRFFRIPAIPPKYLNYFTDVIKDTINTRLTSGIVRPDMIHLFLEARKAKLGNNTEDLSDQSITAQALMFFVGGFLNTTNTMCFMSYELAVNPDVQKKLQKEIDETLKQCNGQITYDALFGMKYMDMVVQETLRKWPSGSVFDRRCVKDYVIAPKLSDEKPLLVEKGTTLLFALGGIHHDPKYYTDPSTFDPERFSDVNKSTLAPFSNIPFGVGPRYCIAARFVLMEIKIIFFHLLSKFDIIPTEKTSIPVKQSKFKLNLGAEGGIWLGLRQRKLNK